jgi:hypothetical protein
MDQLADWVLKLMLCAFFVLLAPVIFVQGFLLAMWVCAYCWDCWRVMIFGKEPTFKDWHPPVVHQYLAWRWVKVHEPESIDEYLAWAKLHDPDDYLKWANWREKDNAGKAKRSSEN